MRRKKRHGNGRCHDPETFFALPNWFLLSWSRGPSVVPGHESKGHRREELPHESGKWEVAPGQGRCCFCGITTKDLHLEVHQVEQAEGNYQDTTSAASQKENLREHPVVGMRSYNTKRRFLGFSWLECPSHVESGMFGLCGLCRSTRL